MRYFLFIVLFSMSACSTISDISPTATPVIILPPATATAVIQSTILEQEAIRIQEALSGSEWQPIYSGLYQDNEQGKIIILVTAQSEAIVTFLTAQGVPTEIYEVRIVETSRQRLEEAEEAALDWLEHDFSGGGSVSINSVRNVVEVYAESEPLIEGLGYDPGNRLIPYTQWPNSLKERLQGIVPGVIVELRGGFGEVET